MDRKELEQLGRDELIRAAEARGVARARALTIPELVDAVLAADASPTRPRGWLGRARDLLTSVIDRGATGAPEPRGRRGSSAPPPLPTVTLAEIYAAQGHLERALTTLDEVLVREPEHAEAARLRDRFTEQLLRVKPSVPPPAIEARPEPMAPPPGRLPFIDPAPAEPADVAAVTGVDPAPAAITASEAAAADALPEEPTLVDAASTESAEGATDLAFDLPVEVDEIVALAVDPTTVYLYWEVRPGTLADARARAADGAVTVRVLGVTPGTRGPTVDTRDIRVDALSGELFVRGLPSATEIRVSVGYKAGEAFEPFAVGQELVTPRLQPSSGVTTEFRRFSEAAAGGRAPMPRPDTLAAGRAGGAVARDADDVALRFPAGVWVDPASRIVRIVEERLQSGEVRGELLTRLPGSSEIFRKTAVWSPLGRAL